MKPPAFWRHGHAAPLVLLPFATLYALATARRVARLGWTAPVPVICCGNPGAGGSGKTPLALDLAGRLLARGRRPAFLTRGHGGLLRGPVLVDASRHGAADVGDEALLLAERAPTYLGADRAASARLAIRDGADVLVMDDGLQNPSLAKNLSLLVIDGGAGFGNGHVIPAGPLREPVAAAAGRCQAAVLIGADITNVASQLPGTLERLAATIVPDAGDVALLPRRILAFAGIGRPSKFFETLRAAGYTPIETREFADHHPYTTAELTDLGRRANLQNAGLVTTAKDLMRIPADQRHVIFALRVRLAWDDEAAIETLLDQVLGA
jgi:tetraacyldisaccharide 4'-kinase